MWRIKRSAQALSRIHSLSAIGLISPGVKSIPRFAGEYVKAAARTGLPHKVIENVRFFRVSGHRRIEAELEAKFLKRQRTETAKQNMLGVVHPRIGCDAGRLYPGQKTFIFHPEDIK